MNEDKKKVEACEQRKHIMILVKSASLGILFGFILEKSKVYDPIIIRDQMSFRKFIMIKMFLSALATSTLSVLVYRLVFKNAYNSIYQFYVNMLKTRSWANLIGGGIILGIGMTVGGSCPGMMFVQFGAGVKNAYISIIGGIIGALVHGIFNERLNNLSGTSPGTTKTFYEYFKVSPFVTYSVAVGGLLSTVAAIEYFLPWNRDFKIEAVPESYGLTSAIWPPMLAGCLLGLLQFPSLSLLNRPLGNSSSFPIIVSQILKKTKIEVSSFFKKFESGIANWDRVIFSAGVILGSFASSNLGHVYGSALGSSAKYSFLGGFCLVLGARIADGCNTGHGISGTGNQFFGSFVAMASMFVGAMGTALFF